MSFNLIKFHEMRYSANEYRYVDATYVATLQKQGWTDKGAVFHAFLTPSNSGKDTNIVPIRAYKNKTYNSSGYRYVSEPDAGAVSSNEWKDVGVAFYAFRNAERGSVEVRNARVANPSPSQYRLVPDGMNIGSGYSYDGYRFYAIPTDAQLTYKVTTMDFENTKTNELENVNASNPELQSEWHIDNDGVVEQRHEETYEKSYSSSMELSFTDHVVVNLKGTYTPPGATGGFGGEIGFEVGHSETQTHIDGILQTFKSVVSMTVPPCKHGRLTAWMVIGEVNADFVAKVEVTGNSSISGALSSKLVGFLVKENNPEVDFKIDALKDAVDVELTGKFKGKYGTEFHQNYKFTDIPGCTPLASASLSDILPDIVSALTRASGG